MTINFAGLPDERPSTLPDPGKYRTLIEKAEMKTPKPQPNDAPGTVKPAYLALTLALRVKPDGTPATGKIYDNLTESDSDYVRYKIKRFIIAMGIPVTNSIELKDIAKIVAGKELYVDITQDLKSTPPKGTVDMFSGEIYYPLDDAPATAPINAPDAADAETPFAADPAQKPTY